MLEGHLATRTFLVGHAVTLADIVACANVFQGFTKVGERERQDNAALTLDVAQIAMFARFAHPHVQAVRS